MDDLFLYNPPSLFGNEIIGIVSPAALRCLLRNILFLKGISRQVLASRLGCILVAI